MIRQSRHPHTQQFARQTNSAPVDELAAVDSVRADAIEPILDVMEELADQIAHIAAHGVEEFFAEDHVMRNAAVGALIRLGESAKRLPKLYVAQCSEINFTGMMKLRDVLAHKPNRIEWGTIWSVISEAMPYEAERIHERRTGL